MAYKLEKPCIENQIADFIVEYNHNKGLTIEETELAYYALEANEIMQEGIPIKNSNYEEEQRQKEIARIKALRLTKRVFALSLQQLGITYTQLKELISTNDQAQLEWDLCVELERSNQLLDVMGAELGITSEQLDEIFVLANQESVG